jgi:transposase
MENRIMPKQIDYTLTKQQLQKIEQAIKSDADLRVRTRARIIRLLHRGYKRSEIAKILSISTGQVHYWHKRWQDQGLAGLADQPRSGRPRVTADDYNQKLEEVLETDPRELGFAFTVWTKPKLLAYMERLTGILIHENTLSNRLRALGYAYLRPKHDLTSLQNKAAKQQAVETIDELKKKPKEERSTYSLWTKRP